MSFQDKDNSWEPRVPSSKRNKNKRQGSGCFQKRLEKNRENRSRRAEDERIQNLQRKYELTTEQLSDPTDDRDIVVAFQGEVVAHFTWDKCDEDDIPEGVVETSDFHVCYCQDADPIFIEQLDGLFDPEPWRYRSDSVGSDCSILDIREVLEEAQDVEMQGSSQQHQSGVVFGADLSQQPPSCVSVDPGVCPSTSGNSLYRAPYSILQQDEPPYSSIPSPLPCSQSDDEIFLPTSPRYCVSPVMYDPPVDGAKYCASGSEAETSAPVVSAPPIQKAVEVTPLKVRLRSGKTIGLSRSPTFRVGWKGVSMTLRHGACYVPKRVLTDDKPIKVVLTNICCWDESVGRFPESLHIAVVGGKCLGRVCEH